MVKEKNNWFLILKTIITLNIIRKILFSILFIGSLPGIPIASFGDWLIISLFVQMIWIAIIANKILKLDSQENKIIQLFIKFNLASILLLTTDIIVIFLSISFLFRPILAYSYQTLMYTSLTVLIISIIGNYYIIINYLIKNTKSISKRILLILSSLCYPIGIWTIDSKISKKVVQSLWTKELNELKHN